MNLMFNILLNVTIAFLLGSLLFGLQRKVMARIQMRPGPPIIQHLLHTLKFYIKESSFPKTAAMPFYIAIASILCVIWVSAVIVGPVTQGSLLLIFAIYALHKIVEHNAGSSSGSPYGKLSCVRAVFSAAAEVPLFAVLIIIYLKTGTMILSDITAYQTQNGALLFTIPLAALMFFVLILSKAPYSPFAITKGKDIISGYETEHFGLLRGYLMISESIAWYMLLWIFLTVFLGPLSLLGYLVGMVVISVIVAFINATTPLLNPNHSIMVQVTLAFIGIVGSIILLML
ncbi:NADH-ubiquinone oxidoreductase [Methanobacterium sp. CWC-01]|uniref:respiratory chain complex I subunit 1 family protein n=1 Tax=Methanobacterium aridiramus TaxID=2584467 RepID=UPI002575A9F3|nr:NADH-quinone oxidoreductase subunit H [Methanobacterium sp. CWC-01]WJI08719.1 NADH-ubiquinone oxidoreductase [Methanobacterium sp. CWC-01]